MCKKVNKQKNKGDGNSQQTINGNVIVNGLTPQEAVSVVNKLFYDNFPKLVEEAKQTVNDRINEIESSLLKAFDDNKITDFSAFKRPDVQYSVLELEKTYAKYGNNDLLNLLTKLVITRISTATTNKIGFALDMAMQLANKLSSADLDFLSLTFVSKMVRFGEVVQGDLNSVCNCYNDIANVLDVNNFDSFEFLQSLNCFCIDLASSQARISKTYGVDESALKKQLSNKYDFVPHDYQLTYPATILAIINLETKTTRKFNLSTWIR